MLHAVHCSKLTTHSDSQAVKLSLTISHSEAPAPVETKLKGHMLACIACQIVFFSDSLKSLKGDWIIGPPGSPASLGPGVGGVRNESETQSRRVRVFMKYVVEQLF